MSWYRTGTVAVTSAGTIVTGSGTSWLDNASAGEGFVGPDGKMYEIASVDSNTQLTLAEAYLGSTASGQSYKITPTQSFIRDLASAVSALVEAYRGVADAIDAGKFTIDASGISAIDINGGTADDVVIGGSSAAAGAFTTLITSSTITASGAVTGTRFIPSGSTVPTNGLYLPEANTLGWAINSAEKMRLDSSGNLGIGVIPTYLLDASHVTGTTTVGNGTVARFVSSTTNGDVNIRLGSGSNSTVRLGANGTDFYVYVNGAERARVDSSGNVGIGTSSPNQKLHVFGNAVDTAAQITKNGTDSIQAGVDSAAYVGAGGAIAFRTGGFTSAYDKAKLDASGNFLVGVTSATSNGGKIETSNGITFPATQSACSNANTLDDYEEGYHTPATVTCGTSGTVTLDSSYDTLSYTKIGRQITVSGNLAVASVSSPVGYFSISLPVAAASLNENSDRWPAVVVVTTTNAANAADFIGWVSSSTLDVYLGDATAQQTDSANELKAGSNIWINVTYFTA